jgi:hypothetical protein
VLTDSRAPLHAALRLDGLEQPADRAPHRDRVRVLGREPLHLGENAQSGGEAVGLDPVHLRRRA